MALQFGPDGALYVVDWFNPLIGHMQHSLRDPNRDHTHGRIWRITYPRRPLVDRPKIAGATVPELLELLKSYEDRTRYRARRELRERPDAGGPLGPGEVGRLARDRARRILAAHARGPLAAPEPRRGRRRRCLKRLLTCPEPHARAAATRVLCYWRDRVPEPLELLRKQVNDEHPRVRLEAIRALSFFEGDQVAKAQEIALESLVHPQDDYLEYTLNETTKTLDQRAKGPVPQMIRTNSLASRSPILAAILSLATIRRSSARSGADEPAGRQPDGEAAQERARARGAPGHGHRDDRPAGHRRRPRTTSISGRSMRALADRSGSKALEALAEAAATRGLKPEKDREKLVGLMAVPSTPAGSPLREAGDPARRGVEARGGLRDAPRDRPIGDGRRAGPRAAIDALAAIGGQAGRSAIEDLAGPGSPTPIRLSAVAALARLDRGRRRGPRRRAHPGGGRGRRGPQAADGGVPQPAGRRRDPGRRDRRRPVPADAAKLALRAVYSLSQADPALRRRAGQGRGDLHRGQAADARRARPRWSPRSAPRATRPAARPSSARKDLNCMTCHSVSKAGGEIGPDLSAIGQTSPPDYIIYSILLPDQSIKEQYHTLVVLTAEGQVYQGIVIDKDNRRVVLKESTGSPADGRPSTRSRSRRRAAR